MDTNDIKDDGSPTRYFLHRFPQTSALNQNGILSSNSNDYGHGVLQEWMMIAKRSLSSCAVTLQHASYSSPGNSITGSNQQLGNNKHTTVLIPSGMPMSLSMVQILFLIVMNPSSSLLSRTVEVDMDSTVDQVWNITGRHRRDYKAEHKNSSPYRASQVSQLSSLPRGGIDSAVSELASPRVLPHCTLVLGLTHNKSRHQRQSVTNYEDGNNMLHFDKTFLTNYRVALRCTFASHHNMLTGNSSFHFK
jgi:hypothetical protein